MGSTAIDRRAALVLLATVAAPAARATGWQGREPPAGVGGALDGVDQHGAPFGLQRVAGAPALVFFGFAHCGSTCPIALATARELLNDGAAAGTSIVFVTLDPLSDGPAQLRALLTPIHPRLLGVTGTPQQIERAAERYGVALRSVAQRIEHSSMWYLLDAAAHVRRIYPHDTSARALLSDIGRLRAAQG